MFRAKQAKSFVDRQKRKFDNKYSVKNLIRKASKAIKDAAKRGSSQDSFYCDAAFKIKGRAEEFVKAMTEIGYSVRIVESYCGNHFVINW